MSSGKTYVRWLMCGLMMITGTALAQVPIANIPLFVTAAVEPNIITAIDDSGSMDSEVLFPTNDGAAWWNTSTDNFVGLDNQNDPAPGIINYNRAGGANGTWKKYTYLFPNGTGGGNRVYRDANNDHYAIPPFDQYGFARSSAYNGLFYDPAITYVPWPDEGGFSFNDANPAAAPSDPVSGGNPLNLTTEVRSNAGNFQFRLHPDMVIPSGVTWFDGTWRTQAADQVFNNNSSRGVEYYPATYFVLAETTKNYTVRDPISGALVSGNCGAPDPLHYLYYSQSPSSLSGTDSLGFDGRCLTKVEIRNDGREFPSGRSYADEMQNFANWFSYYRKRHMATRAGLSKTLSPLTGLRLGGITINSRNLRGMYSLSEQSERDDFFDFIYRVDGNSGGTPNRQALDFIGSQFDNNSRVITDSCQQNFALLFTDGFTNVNTSSGVGNSDGGRGVPFEDSSSNTIADIADYYYHRNLRGSAFDRDLVPVPNACFATDPPPWADCRDDLHMVTYGITLGAQGDVFGVTHHNVKDAHEAPPEWRAPTINRNPVQVDDLYHAAVNSRGEMLNAQNSQRLEEVLGEALLDIVSRTNATATAATTSAAILQEDTLLYNVEFRSTDWSGNVDAKSINEVTGQVQSTVWSAETKLAARSPSSRQIFTWDGSSGTAFTTSDLTGTQKDALAKDASGNTDGLSEERIRWFRGEAVSGLRSRNSVVGRRLIGDIVNSRPTYVKPENRGYFLLPDDFSPGTYLNFLSDISDRNPMLAAGTNGGFMHVFDAINGEELFAYMPSELLAGTGPGGAAPVVALTDPAYEHRFFVDGTPAIDDVLVNGVWRTVLVGTMGVGGRTVFAIDVTDPANIDSSDILWEFTDPDLGYGVTEPQITPLANGEFGVVFGNGVNSNSNSAHLFVVDMADGSLIKKIDTGEGDASSPNGLSSVQTTDWPDAGQVSLYVYGGDLQGNMWRFDISDPNVNKWGVDLLFVATDSDGDRQPITSAPRLAPAPQVSGELMVLFGTGSYYRMGDDSLSDPQVQTLYGIRDSLGNKAIERDDLLQQEIIWQTVDNALGEFRLLREVSRNTYAEKKPESGWYLDLIYDGNNVGERVISRPTFPSGPVRERIRFTTMTPNDDPCTAGREGFVFDIDMFTGGGTEFSVFDIDGDELIGASDFVDGRVVSGIGGGQGEELTVIRTQDGRGDYFYTGEGQRVGSGDGADGLAAGIPVGRQSWQQLR